jgi:hypothetical protein
MTPPEIGARGTLGGGGALGVVFWFTPGPVLDKPGADMFVFLIGGAGGIPDPILFVSSTRGCGVAWLAEFWFVSSVVPEGGRLALLFSFERLPVKLQRDSAKTTTMMERSDFIFQSSRVSRLSLRATIYDVKSFIMRTRRAFQQRHGMI